MQNIILVIHLILALSLIGIVLMQRSEGGGLGMGGGGNMSGRPPANAMTKLTWIIAVGFIATSISLVILSARENSSDSVLERAGTETTQSAPEAPASPALGNNLLPPSADDAPATPPKAEE